MNDEFEKWFDKAIDDELFELTAPSAQYKAAKAAWEASTKATPRRFGCHFEMHDNGNEPWIDCLIDEKGDKCDCVYQNEYGVKIRLDCPYWHEIKED